MWDHQIVVLDRSRSIVVRRNETNLGWDQLMKKSTKVAYVGNMISQLTYHTCVLYRSSQTLDILFVVTFFGFF